MTEQAPEGAPTGDDDTAVFAGQPGPAGSGEQTDAGADPDAEPAADVTAEPSS